MMGEGTGVPSRSAELAVTRTESGGTPASSLTSTAAVPAAPVNTVDQVMNDPQTAARRLIERVVHPRLGEIPVIGTPVKFSRMRPGVRTPAPLQGEHTDDVLAEYGYSAERIAELRAHKVIL
jgi:crotonobetainyl-CoA:carnitine CoA-transferase CaiB-like acyl-CoA transferase